MKKFKFFFLQGEIRASIRPFGIPKTEKEAGEQSISLCSPASVCSLLFRGRAIVLTSSTSFAFSQARKLIRSAARPLPTEIASLDFGGGPCWPLSPFQGAP